VTSVQWAAAHPNDKLQSHSETGLAPKQNVRVRWLVRLMLFGALGSFSSLLLAERTSPSLDEILQRSLDRELRNLALLEKYIYDERQLQYVVDGKGARRMNEDQTAEVHMVAGSRIEKLIARNGRELTGKDKEKADREFDKAVAKARNTSAEKRAKQEAEFRKRRDEARRELLPGFAWRLDGEEVISGRKAWKVWGEPKPGFRFRTDGGKIFAKTRGHLWIDQQDYTWSRIDVEVFDTISFGWFLARLQKGTRARLEQNRINDEIWLPKTVEANFQARFLGAMVRRALQVNYSNYRKFSTDMRIVDNTEQD
jgi:hypothetical protein